MKKSFAAGLIILLPIAVTVFLLSLILEIFTSPFVDGMTNLLSGLEGTMPHQIIVFFARIIIIMLFCVGIFLLGVLARLFLFKVLLSGLNKILLKIPVFKSIYHTVKDLIGSVFSIDEKKAFKHPLMISFPSEKSSCVAFLSGSTPKECEKVLNKELVPVFVPTAPHPISGYMVLAPKDQVDEIKMTNEEAIKFTVSCGVITPENKEIENEKKS